MRHSFAELAVIREALAYYLAEGGSQLTDSKRLRIVRTVRKIDRKLTPGSKPAPDIRGLARYAEKLKARLKRAKEGAV